jgi:hypothetical protein
MVSGSNCPDRRVWVLLTALGTSRSTERYECLKSLEMTRLNRRQASITKGNNGRYAATVCNYGSERQETNEFSIHEMALLTMNA